MKKKIVALLMSAAMVFSMVACGSSDSAPAVGTDNTETAEENSADEDEAVAEASAGEPVVIRYGTHYVPELDPYYVDEVTGEYTMGERERQASLAALEEIKNQLNVEFEFIQYSGDVRNDLMTSVLAGNPIRDLAIIWGGAEGTILAQNILQQLDEYEDIFADEESSWMWYDKLYGHNYMLSNVVNYKQKWPLMVNLSMIEQVDSLKDAEGNTIYPMDLFLAGDWTWSTFEDYLTKIQSHYSGVAAPDGCIYDNVQAYETDHRFAGLSAMYSNGGGIYGADGLAVDSEESIEGVQYIENLMSKKLLADCGLYDDAYTPQWCRSGDDFAKGGAVFSDVPGWYVPGNASACAERGESVGIVPWPRPDRLEMNDPAYKQVNTLADSVGVLKGIGEEKTKLALEAYRLYWLTYYKVMGGVDSMASYLEETSVAEMAAQGLDIYNETYGDQLVDCFNYIGQNLANDYADLLGLRVPWDDIVGKSIYGLEGMSSYDVSIKANATDFTNVISNMESILASNEIKDNRGPDIQKENAAVAAGTTTEEIDWTQYFTATDAVDGNLDITTATVTVGENLDLTTPGKYDGAVELKIADAAGNESSAKIAVNVYDADNTEAPVVTVVEELPTVAVDTDTSTITWKGNYIESAVDADGLDVSDNILADLSELDTTTAGTYNVAVTVTDFAGNETVVTLEVTVATAE